MTDDPDDLAARDRALGAATAEAARAHMDTGKVATEAEALMEHLTRSYESTLLPQMLDADTPPALERGLRLLVRQLARAQADLFALKSVVLGRDRLALSRDWDHVDPLRAQIAALGTDMARLGPAAHGPYVLKPDDTMLGYGWHATEHGAGRSWRWSGPGPEAGIYLPNVAQARCRLELEVAVPDRAVLPEGPFLSVDGTPLAHEIDWTGALEARVTVEADLAPGAPAFLLGVRLARTVSPAEAGTGADRRTLGLCLKSISYSVLQ